jgi:Domain of unknown function (DUF4148)
MASSNPTQGVHPVNHPRSFFLVSAFALIAGAALAQPGSGWTPFGVDGIDGEAQQQPPANALTRQQVRTEFLQAQREGHIVNGNLAVLNGLLGNERAADLAAVTQPPAPNPSPSR